MVTCIHGLGLGLVITGMGGRRGAGKKSWELQCNAFFGPFLGIEGLASEAD